MRRFPGLAALLLTLFLGALPATPHAAGIVFAHPGAPYSDAIDAVVVAILKDRFGVPARTIHASAPVIFKAMDANKGEIDVLAGVQQPNSKSFIDEYVIRKGTVVLSSHSWQFQQGVCTVKPVADRFGIKTIYDMVRPEVVQLTAKPGSAMGELWVGGAEWNSTAIDKVRARFYGLSELYELTTSQADFEYARVASAIKIATPIFWSCDSASNFVFPKDAVVLLDEPPHDPAKWHPVLPSQDPDWYRKSAIETSWPPVSNTFAYAKHLQTDLPEVARALDGIDPTPELVGSWTYATVTEKRDLNEYAEEWVRNNAATVNRWLGR